ncbi:MAG: UPF0149 family protein [Gammaproteobacteria bacterium]|nr:UPF0149 family protein [Gammaproteobacteria bacterium]
MTDLDYSTIQSSLQRIAVETSPAECHGQLCGLLSSLPELSYTAWLEMALPELIEAKNSGNALAAETDGLLQQLFADTEQGIVDRELGFQLYISGDDESLAVRLEQLAEWCSGFLLGLAMGGIKEFKGLPGDIPELLDDLVEFSRAGSFTLENEEEDENAYMELNEYVRMGVMLVKMELSQLHSSHDDGHVSIH